ncbi:hypothetical protein [Corynebacterium sp. A21]|uniref:hypothetical protein n=1 Tax=Corynebacterium sp. A21 TaxID=3457318 RepID=UPI003FD47BFB
MPEPEVPAGTVTKAGAFNHSGGATISIATAAVVLLAALDGMFLRENPLFAVAAAAVVSAGAAAAVLALVAGGFRGLSRWVSALGGTTLLAGGAVHALNQFTTAGAVEQALIITATHVVPFAALLCFLGGVAQLPGRWAAAALSGVGGTAVCAWFSLGPATSPLLCAVGALATVTGAILALRLIRIQTAELIPREILRKMWSVLVGAAVICAVVSYLLAATILPGSRWSLLLTPGEVVWCFFAATVLLALSALRHGGRLRLLPVA